MIHGFFLYLIISKKPNREDSLAGDSVTVASDDTGLLSSPSKKGRRKKKRAATNGIYKGWSEYERH